eukprot:6044487-Heterocapsa_arctica.AAC.1
MGGLLLILSTPKCSNETVTCSNPDTLVITIELLTQHSSFRTNSELEMPTRSLKSTLVYDASKSPPAVIA